MIIYIYTGVVMLAAVCLIVQRIRCSKAVRTKMKQLSAYNAQNIQLGCGNMSYADKGNGEVILSVHGIFGGYDQAFDTCRDFAADHRILAPSRFGYLGSDVCGDGTPAEQAAAFAELLDRLGIDKAYILAASAGGSVAIRFALDYPQCTKGLILYCSAMPFAEKPEKYAEYAGPPAFLCNDYAMFLLSPMFEPLMGMKPSTIYDMFPITERKAGVVLDAAVTNPDMARHFDDYRIEDLQIPILILHSKDDRLASYDAAVKAAARFPDCTFVSFESGGHLMRGHADEVKKAVCDFIEKHK